VKRSKNRFVGVCRVVDRHGGVRWRFRSKGVDCYLRGPYGSADFVVDYEAAVSGVGKAAIRSSPTGTLAWLIERYLDSARYRDLSDIRKKTLRLELDWMRSTAGDLPFARFAPHHVEALMNKKEGPTAANTVKKNLSMLFNFAIKQQFGGQTFNPARYADRRRENADGYHTWSADEIAQFLAFHGPGTKARLALLIFLCTGASRQDAARMGWQNVKLGRISYVRGKTKVGADLPILPELQDELRHVPRDQLLFLTHGPGRPYKPETLGNWFRDRCRDADLAIGSPHGLRKAGATRLADSGASAWEIASYLAHKDTKMADVYVRKANRARLADSGMGRLKSLKSEQDLSNLEDRLDKIPHQGIKNSE
jgi:integrase